jgi:hypothetical protein
MLSLNGVRLGSQTTYAAPGGFVSSEVQCQESMGFKNSDLRSKCPNGSGYILQVTKQILRVGVLGKPPIQVVIIVGSSHSPSSSSSMSHIQS